MPRTDPYLARSAPPSREPQSPPAPTAGQADPAAYALLTQGLVKTYRGGRGKPPVRALDGLSLRVERGRVFGLLGPNGAGKSTTVRILATLTRQDDGRAYVDGLDVARNPVAVRSRIGLVSQKPGSDPMSTGRENLVLAGRLQGLSASGSRARADALLERFGLAGAAGRLAKTYSGGMARKLDVALGLVHAPRVLFLDEPTTGLDPEARTEMWAEVARLSTQEDTTVLLTTHYLEEADHLADELAIVDHGRVVAQGSPEALKSGLRGDAVSVELVEAASAAAAQGCLARISDLSEVTAEGRTVRARADLGSRAIPLVLAALDQAGVAVSSATVARPSLDDVYLRHVGRSFTEVAE